MSLLSFSLPFFRSNNPPFATSTLQNENKGGGVKRLLEYFSCNPHLFVVTLPDYSDLIKTCLTTKYRIVALTKDFLLKKVIRTAGVSTTIRTHPAPPLPY